MHTKSKEELLNFLKKEIDNTDGLIVIQAGHFALVHDEKNDKSIPGIFGDIEDEEQRNIVKSQPYMGYFPIETLKMGIELIKYARGNKKKAKLAIAINDWQWVKKVGSGEINKYREEYYQNSILPESYIKELESNGLGAEIILPSKTHEGEIFNDLFFSETRLRKRFNNYFSKTCSLDNECAKEYIPLLNELNDQGIKLFISFIPETCIEPIISGSKKSKEIYNMHSLKIINIFPNGIFKDNFWEDIEISIA